VFAGEVVNLSRQLRDAADGKKFLLQGGDCAERFRDCTPEAITSKLKILLQMAAIISHGAHIPLIRVGRIAGQYAKPRSAEHESHDGELLPVFRGDNINSFTPDRLGRRPDPSRLLEGYHLASITLNYIRAMIAGGFADIHHPEHWNLRVLKPGPHRDRYEQVLQSIQDAVAFMESLGGIKQDSLSNIDFFTSHEGLLLGFEESMTRYVPEYDGYFNLGAHMLWIGDRTRHLDGAHVEYFRGIKNPIGIKWGPETEPHELVRLIKVLSPNNEPGRITIITRFGADLVANLLPAAIQAVTGAGLAVLWSSDPMHGNVIKTKNNMKTRDFGAILSELRSCFEIHRALGSHLGGVHFELTGDDVTECTGGSEGLAEHDLPRNYETFCDPRLNYSQSLEMAFLMAEILKDATIS
jgi:3-deoxy-7-phosphoheptulonate synthase